MTFHGMNVVVTGGAHGIGLAISQAFAEAGGSVWILDQEPDAPAAGIPDKHLAHK